MSKLSSYLNLKSLGMVLVASLLASMLMAGCGNNQATIKPSAEGRPRPADPATNAVTPPDLKK